MLLREKARQEQETVEQFLARGGTIQRIENYPDPDGRVLLRGQRFNARPIRPQDRPQPSRIIQTP